MQESQSCSAFLQEDGTISLWVWLTNGLASKYGKYFWMHGIRFTYGDKEVLAALEERFKSPYKA